MAETWHRDLRELAAAAASGDVDAVQVAFRAKVGMLVATAEPSASEMAALIDLAHALVPRLDEATAVTIAARLAAWKSTPASIRGLFFARGGKIAAALLREGAPLPEGISAEALAEQGEIDSARVLASRSDIDAETCRLLLERDDAGIDRALAANTALALPRDVMDMLVARARQDRLTADLLLARPELSQADVAPLYLMANDARRAAIRQALTSLNNVSAARTASASPDVASWRELDRIAGHDPAVALSCLAAWLGGGPRVTAALAQDTTRELAALALTALGFSVEQGTRFLIRLGDEAARSVQRIFAHVDLMRTVPPGVALRILVAVCDDPALRLALAGPASPARHTPAMAEGGVRRVAGAERTQPQRTLAGTIDRALRRDQSGS